MSDTETREGLVKTLAWFRPGIREAEMAADAILAAIDAKVEARLAAMEAGQDFLATELGRRHQNAEDALNNADGLVRAVNEYADRATRFPGYTTEDRLRATGQPSPAPREVTPCPVEGCQQQSGHDGDCGRVFDAPAPRGPSEAALAAIERAHLPQTLPFSRERLRWIVAAGYAVDVPAIERAAAERAVRHLEGEADEQGRVYLDVVRRALAGGER